MRRLWPVGAVLQASLCFATTGTARALADLDAGAVSVGAVRVVVGGGLLGLLALAIRQPRSEAPVPRAARSSGAPTWAIVLVGAVGVVAYQPAFFTGTRLNGVAVGTVVALGSAPVATGLLNSAMRRQLPSLRWLSATAVALVGVALVAGLVGPQSASATVSVAGLGASLGAGASYGLYAVAGKVLLDRGWTSRRSMGSMFGVAAVVSVPIAAATSLAWLATPSGLALAIWLGVVTVTVAYLLFGWGLRQLPPTSVSTLTLAEPAVATLLGVIVLSEHLSVSAVAGLVVITTGLLLLAAPDRPRRSRVGSA